MKTVMIVLVLIVCVAAAADNLPKPTVVKKNLGDINGDGKKEVAIEKTSWGVSSCSTEVKILSGSKTILALPVFIGDTADGYNVVGKQIIVWRGDWDSVQSKWKPHFYDFIWYQWNTKKRKFEVKEEGFTKKPYDYENAKTKMPVFAKTKEGLVVSNAPTFAKEAMGRVHKKFGYRPVKVEATKATTVSPSSEARYCRVDIAMKNMVAVAQVTYFRNGEVKVFLTNE